uniref:Zinc (Zn2 )Iron (Fe2 ) Permease (ZIP) Family putati n=1 Tax=Albugo laibachii Nc14 TaxID=890382 RepID=F0W2Z1_9STRA|nr:Zinc (Zn2)Iron (Fe2) Permease (ZIP) Family putati [Albugo laibachii Nc14]|eukprot:CCA15428.1 Zinc (Zn2)Iron (Fe2) Permease (ZIP) Family putati [Albugo laibachii Nc14]
MKGRQFVSGALLLIVFGIKTGSHVVQDKAHRDGSISNLPIKSNPNQDRAIQLESEQSKHHHHHYSERNTELPRYKLSLWMEALTATFIIGSVPIALLIFIPTGIGAGLEQKNTLRAFLGFAAGGLLGDAFLHLMPHSISIHKDHGGSYSTQHGHLSNQKDTHSLSDLSAWLWTIAGIMIFFILDKVVRHKHGAHSHSVIDPVRVDTSHQPDESSGTKSPLSSVTRRASKSKEDMVSEVKNLTQSSQTAPKKRSIAASGYLSLVADFSHNFTDGLAIGATFLRGSGWQTTAAILLHELPHELGDFAILIRSGFEHREAIYLQILTALGAMIGTALGLLIESANADSAWISPFIAGGFIYIACSSILPELLEDCSVWQSTKEVLTFIAGLILMIGITFLE